MNALNPQNCCGVKNYPRCFPAQDVQLCKSTPETLSDKFHQLTPPRLDSGLLMSWRQDGWIVLLHGTDAFSQVLLRVKDIPPNCGEKWMPTDLHAPLFLFIATVLPAGRPASLVTATASIRGTDASSACPLGWAELSGYEQLCQPVWAPNSPRLHANRTEQLLHYWSQHCPAIKAAGWLR